MRLQGSHIFVVAGLMVTACAGIPAHEGLPPAAKDQISSTEVVLPIQQSEIYVYVPPETAGQTSGLIGALVDVTVDAIRTGKAETSVKRLRDALVDYNFDTVMQSHAKTALTQVPWPHGDHVHVVKEVSKDSFDQALAASRDAAVIFTTTDYQLSNDADQLSVTVNASLFPRTDALRALKQGKTSSTPSSVSNSLYHNTLKFEYRAPRATSDRDSNMQNWSANNGAAMRTALNAAAAKLAWMVAQDIESSMTSPAGAIPDTDRSGTVVRKDDGSLTFMAMATP